VLQDLGSANGTLYNGANVESVIHLTAGGRIQIGETEIIFDDGTFNSGMGATMITDNTSESLPEATIALASGDRTTSGLLEAIEGARTKPEEIASTVTAVTPKAKHGDLLALISKVGITLLSSATLNETLEQIVSLVFEAVPADRCVIMMRDEGSEDLRVAVARLRDRVGEVGEIRVSRNVLDEVVIRGKSVLTSDAQHDPRFASGTMVLQGVRAVLAVPLGVTDKVFGIIYADSPIAEGRFTEDHLKVLTTLASVAAIRVENARLIEARLERERLERELALASEIQQRFQPTAPPHVNGYELQGISFPCYEIGGDYYDFIEREDGRLVIALGDVSGKGTAAALLMSSLHAAIHAQSASHDSLVATISAVNRYLADNIPANRFVTLFYAELDPESGSLSFLNAGHNPPLIVHSAGTVEQLASGGLPLGIKRDADYREGRTQLQLGDVLVIYSDGVTEAMSPTGEEFGATRLYEVVSRNIEASAAGIRDRIESSLTKFAQGTSAADDITLVIVKRQM
jgi:serine phosphatase RsbU (regulator of sigma subunit)